MQRKTQRTLSAVAVEQQEDAFAQEHNIELGRNANQTPTSAFLAPILERPTAKRKFRKPPSKPFKSGFPEIDSKSPKNSSFLARKRGSQSIASKQNDAVDPPDAAKTMSEADKRLAAMSQNEIQSALDEIHQALPAELVSILKARGAKTAQSSSPSIDKSLKSSAIMEPNHNSDAAKVGNGGNSKRKQVHFANQDDDNIYEKKDGTKFLVDSGVPVEKQKLEWLNDADEVTQNQKLVDETLRDCSKQLGEYGSYRFNFDGSVLSDTEMKELPSHLGLHHHGADPSKAGYTLVELILLTRSSVPSQRILAFSTLTNIIETHRSNIIPLLCTSKAIALLFTDFEKSQIHAGLTDHGTRASHTAFAQSLMIQCPKIPERALTRDVYFDSLFYSPDSLSPTHELSRALQDTDFVAIFIRFAHSCFLAKLFDPCRDALMLVRQVLQSCDVSVGCGIIEKVNLRHLNEICLDRNGSLVTFLACDILSSFMLYAGWGNLTKGQVHQDLFSDKKLRSIAAHIQEYLFHPIRMNENQHLISAAALRVLRAALVFRRGMDIFADCLSAISSVCAACNSGNDNSERQPSLDLAAKEAFYGLEAYVFAIRSSALENQLKDGDNADLLRNVSKQIVSLLPISHVACSIFTSGAVNHCVAHRAAAAHFLGTFYSAHLSPISAKLIPPVLELATQAANVLETNADTGDLFFDTVAFIHGASRMLVKCALPGPPARRISLALLNATEICDGREQRNRRQTRILANAASEWLVKVAGTGSSKETAEQALSLLKKVSDPRVLLELLFKCVVNAELICFLNPKINIEMARRYVDKLKEHTVNTLINEKGGLDNSSRTKEELNNLNAILKNWLSSRDTFTEGATVALTLVNANLIPAPSVYNIIPFANLFAFDDQNSRFSQLVFRCGSKTYQSSSQAFDDAQTRISPFSSEKRPVLAERLISLGEELAERGPFVDESATESEASNDCLASIVFNLIFQRDAHVSLRLHLWKLCVRDCGGGALFEHAKFFGNHSALKKCDDDDELLAELSSSLADGALTGARCPTMLQKIVLGRLEARLSSERNHGVLRPILSMDDAARQETVISACFTGWERSKLLVEVVQKLRDARIKVKAGHRR